MLYFLLLYCLFLKISLCISICSLEFSISNIFYIHLHFSELREQRDRENDLKYDEKERKSHRKRKSRFGDSDDLPEKTMVFLVLYNLRIFQDVTYMHIISINHIINFKYVNIYLNLAFI